MRGQRSCHCCCLMLLRPKCFNTPHHAAPSPETTTALQPLACSCFTHHIGIRVLAPARPRPHDAVFGHQEAQGLGGVGVVAKRVSAGVCGVVGLWVSEAQRLTEHEPDDFPTHNQPLSAHLSMRPGTSSHMHRSGCPQLHSQTAAACAPHVFPPEHALRHSGARVFEVRVLVPPDVVHDGHRGLAHARVLRCGGNFREMECVRRQSGRCGTTLTH